MNQNSQVIRVAQDFSRYPAGRYRDDGPWSGERFREELLVPALEMANKVIVYLDGTRGYGSSFLEEAFGGLVRRGFTPDRIRTTIQLESADPSLRTEILDYVDHAAVSSAD